MKAFTTNFSKFFTKANLRNNAIGFTITLSGALLANFLHTPLPWLLGALFAVALWKITGQGCDCDNTFRQAGQWVIGTSLGLHFTPAILPVIAGMYDSLLIGVSFSITLGIIGAMVLYRWLGIDFPTAWFASMVGGASEMATMAETYGGRVDFVASAHTLRVMLVVTTIPFAFSYLGIHGDMVVSHEAIEHFSLWGFLALVASSGTLAVLLGRIRFPVAWVLAPLVVAAILTLCDVHLTSLPAVVKHAGQLFIGWSLGNKFSKGFFSRSPKFLSAVALYNLLGLGLTVGMAYLLAKYSGVDVPTLVLSLSSGGIAEMTITAESLHLGVAVVTIFHVLRMTTVVIFTQPMFMLVRRWVGKK